MPSPDPAALFAARFDTAAAATISVPGRVNLIGEHIDYHLLPVLPIAIDRRIHIAFRLRADRRIRAASDVFGDREFEWNRPPPTLRRRRLGELHQSRGPGRPAEMGCPLQALTSRAVVSDLPPSRGPVLLLRLAHRHHPGSPPGQWPGRQL
ncbi:MAG: galactokinase family protein [Paludibaculum sp.]